MSRWTITLVGCMLAATSLASVVTAQTGKSASSPHKPPSAKHGSGPRSTLDGVYTDAQARRGKDVYFGSCRSCHSAESHTGATFAQWWKGKQLSDLFVFVATKMPKNDPGSLAPEDAADVVSYILKLNKLPAGKSEMIPDADSLMKYRIDVRSSGKASAPSAAASPADGDAAEKSKSSGSTPVRTKP